MKYRKQSLLILLVWITFVVYSQTSYKSLTVEDLTKWERITEQAISDNGTWIACKMEPWQGDAAVHLYHQAGKRIKTFQPAGKFSFSPSSQYLIVTIKPSQKETDALKLNKTKSEDMPMDQLIIYNVQGKEEVIEVIDSIKTYKLSQAGDWLAYQRGNKNDSTLIIRSLDGEKKQSFHLVTDFNFAEKGPVLYYSSRSDSIGNTGGVYSYLLETDKNNTIHTGEGRYKQITFNQPGNKLAFLYSSDMDTTSYQFSLFLSENNQIAKKIVDNTTKSIPANWIVSSNGSLRFSEDSRKLFFGIAPQPQQKDSTLLHEYRPNVQVWKWDEGVQYTQQNHNKKNDLEKTYSTVYHLRTRQIIRLTDENIPTIQTTDQDNANIGLVPTTQSYDVERMWRGRDKKDIYLINLETGKKELLKKGVYTQMNLSPKGQYVYGYNPEDSCWYAYSIRRKREFKLTSRDKFIAWNEDNDVPEYPSPYGIAGWSENDEFVYIYDRYDIWKLDPQGRTAPVNITVNGRKQKIIYRFVGLDKEAKHIDSKKFQILRGFNEITKGEGYYQFRFSQPQEPIKLITGDFMLKTLVKAKNTDNLIYTVESFTLYPDLQVSDMTFKKSVRLTEGYKQQEDINWGNAELVSWTSLDGKSLEGVVYKPDDFDPTKKYPVIVNFYEKNSSTLHRYRMPEPHRSTIDYHLYLSNGYIIFNPDIVYHEGYPGESCYNCVMPGISSLISKGYIDEKAIGAQGHSWGGYQVAYLATRTNLFAAIESGAPVVNMFNAYGGIRWSTGLNRSFQYEHGQSRIGATPWEMPLRYMENSPIFTMDKVETPILIMHNDADGHVPWHLGVEYFIALRRLQKPVWLLNYPGEPHWPMKVANRIDFQKRMFQFFSTI